MGKHIGAVVVIVAALLISAAVAAEKAEGFTASAWSDDGESRRQR